MRMKKMNSLIHLRDYFPDFVGENSLFQKMVIQGAPWDNSVGEAMDRAYFTMYSGIKNPSDFVTQNLAGDYANSITIAAILYSIYGESWTRLWEAYKTKYNPIENYNMQETTTSTRQDDRTISRTNDLTSTVDGTGTQTNSSDGTETSNTNTSNNVVSDSNGTSSLEHGEQIKRDGEADSYTYGFNSQEKVPTSVQIENATDVHSGVDTTTTSDHSTSDATGISKTDTTAHSEGTLNTSTKDVRADKIVEDTMDNLEGKEDTQRNRTGNIGVTTTQQMLQQEFELWRWNFFTQVFEDVDKFLVLSVYSDCPYHINKFSQLN